MRQNDAALIIQRNCWVFKKRGYSKDDWAKYVKEHTAHRKMPSMELMKKLFEFANSVHKGDIINGSKENLKSNSTIQTAPYSDVVTAGSTPNEEVGAPNISDVKEKEIVNEEVTVNIEII